MFASFSITDATNVRLGIEPTFIITSANATGWLVDFAWKKKWIIKKTIDVAFNLLKPIGPLLYSCRECLRALALSSGVLSFLFLRNVLGCDTASIAQWLYGLKLKELTVTIIGYDFRVRFRFTVIIPVALLILNDSSGSLAAIWNNETQRYVCL